VATDFNSDGKTDLAISNAGSGTVSILFGNGDGSFQPQVPHALGGNPSYLVAADLNGDGKTDLTVSRGADDVTTVLLGTGTGTFLPATNYTPCRLRGRQRH
jgi:hypothetical protein